MSDAVSKTGRWIDLANPTRFLSLAGGILPWLGGLTALVLAIGFWMSMNAPDDYQQGSTVKIMFIHVPFAWLSMMCYTIMSDRGARNTGMAPPAGRCFRQGCCADRGCLHCFGADHRLALG